MTYESTLIEITDMTDAELKELLNPTIDAANECPECFGLLDGSGLPGDNCDCPKKDDGWGSLPSGDGCGDGWGSLPSY